MDELSSLSIEEIYHQSHIQSYLQIFSVSCLFWDHIVTLRLEVEHLWSRPKTASAYWFFLNRYFAFCSNVLVTSFAFSTLGEESGFGYSCKNYTLFRQILLIVNQVLVCVLLTLRIFALYNRSRVILAYMLTSGAILAGLACYVLFGQASAVATQVSGCHTGLARITAIRLAGAWEALFVYDSILFGLTLYKTLKERHDHRVTGININLISLILRDGCMYFAVMALCNLANILTFYFCGPYLRGSLSTFASSISVTMMSRLMLNLHQTADEGLYSTQKTSTNFEYITNDLAATTATTTTNRIELDTIWSSGPSNATTTTSGGVSSFDASGSEVFRRGREGELVLRR